MLVLALVVVFHLQKSDLIRRNRCTQPRVQLQFSDITRKDIMAVLGVLLAARRATLLMDTHAGARDPVRASTIQVMVCCALRATVDRAGARVRVLIFRRSAPLTFLVLQL